MESAGDILRKMGKGTGMAKKGKTAPKSDEQIIAEGNALLLQNRAETAPMPILAPPSAAITGQQPRTRAEAPETSLLAPPKAVITRQQLQLIEAGADIRERWPGPSDLSFMAKHLVQVTLPHSDPGDIPLWTKTNGDVTLVIARTAVDDDANPIGYPYGVIPRLLLFWITTEAVRNKNKPDTNPRLIELGNNLSQFMRDVGLDPGQGGGKRSDAKRMRDQMNRLFAASISFQQSRKSEGLRGQRTVGMLIAPRRELWWDPRNLSQGSLWQSWIELGEDFYNAVTTSAVPVDIRALRALRKSPLALDLYGWATYKAFSLYSKGQAQVITYRDFMRQFGTDYSDPKNFKKKLVAALKKVQAVYPQLKIQSVEGGVKIYPSRPAVPISGVRPLNLP
jgi:hypothetical protein